MGNENLKVEDILTFLKEVKTLMIRSESIATSMSDINNQMQSLSERYKDYPLDTKKAIVYLYLENMRTWNLNIVDVSIIREIQRNLKVDETLFNLISEKDYSFNDEFSFNTFLIDMLKMLINPIEEETKEALIKKSNLVDFKQLLKSDSNKKLQISNLMKVLINEESVEKLSKLYERIKGEFVPYVIEELKENPEGNYGLIKNKRIVNYIGFTLVNNNNIYKKEWNDVFNVMLNGSHIDKYKLRGWQDSFVALIEVMPGFNIKDIEEIKDKIISLNIVKKITDEDDDNVKIKLSAEKYLNKIEMLNSKKLNGMNTYLINRNCEETKSAYEKEEICEDELIFKLGRIYLNARGFNELEKEGVKVIVEIEVSEEDGRSFNFIAKRKYKEILKEMIENTTNPNDEERDKNIEKIIDKLRMKEDIELKSPEKKKVRKF